MMKTSAIWTLFVIFVTVRGNRNKRSSFGVVLPDDPYVFITNDLRLTCNLTSAISETSSSLYFTKGGNVIPKAYIQILSSRSILLTYPIVSSEDEGLYICKLNQTGASKPYVIGEQFVRVDYAPRQIESFNCRVYNWESMTCSWDLGVNYSHLEHIEVQLVWTVRDASQYDCPHITTNSCHWMAVDGLNSFRPDMLYYMMVIVRNTKTGNETKSPLFKEDTRKLVQPSSVSGLTTSHNSTCLQLQWEHSSWENKMYRIQYQSRWESSWKVLKLDNIKSKTICNLVPNTEYTIKIACKPEWDGFWSDEVETTIKLDEDVPGASPELQPGGYMEKPCSFKDCRVIVVYWRPIMDRLTNGEITNYKLSSHDTEGLDSPTQAYTGTRTEGQLMLSAEKDYVVDIQGETRKGVSPHMASILILAKDKKPPYPNDFVVESERIGNSRKYELEIRWSQPSTKQRILGYTLFWCKGSGSDQICQEPLKWAVLKGNQNNYRMTVDEVQKQSLLFGISMETVHSSGETVSSGILWSDCIFIKNRKPMLAPKNVRVLSLIEENSLLVEWDRFKCQETEGYIKLFTVFYCMSQPEQNCSGKYHALDVDGHKTGIKLKDMSPQTTYRVWVQAKSEAGFGPESDAVFTTIPVTGLTLTTEEIAGIVVASFCVIIFALIGGICLFRRCAVEVKEQFKPYDIDLPNVPLPPIPMIRPSSRTSTSPDDDDEIYSKIAEFPSPSSPESVSIDMPLINRSESQNKSLYGEKKKYVKLPDRDFFAKLSLGKHHKENSDPQYHDNKNLSTFRPRPKKGSNGLSSSVDMLSCVASPYSCVDIVQCPNSEKIARKHLPCSKPCHSVGSMVDDPAYETNNLSVLSNKTVTKPPTALTLNDSREHFNIKLPLDRRKSDIMSNTLNSCVSNEMNSVTETDEETQDSNEISEDKISSYVQEANSGEIDNSTFEPGNLDYVQDPSCPKCSNNNNIKMKNGYITTENMTEMLTNPNIVVVDEGDNYRKELNIKPGPRPVSEVINVPAHFYGSLSLLDTGTATEL